MFHITGIGLIALATLVDPRLGVVVFLFYIAMVIYRSW
jgi:hypothetical protein